MIHPSKICRHGSRSTSDQLNVLNIIKCNIDIREESTRACVDVKTGLGNGGSLLRLLPQATVIAKTLLQRLLVSMLDMVSGFDECLWESDG